MEKGRLVNASSDSMSDVFLAYQSGGLSLLRTLLFLQELLHRQSLFSG